MTIDFLHINDVVLQTLITRVGIDL